MQSDESAAYNKIGSQMGSYKSLILCNPEDESTSTMNSCQNID